MGIGGLLFGLVPISSDWLCATIIQDKQYDIEGNWNNAVTMAKLGQLIVAGYVVAGVAGYLTDDIAKGLGIAKILTSLYGYSAVGKGNEVVKNDDVAGVCKITN